MKVWRSTGAILGGLAMALLAAGPAGAQESTGNIYGHVTDEQGGVLPGATIALKGCGGPQTTYAGTRGDFHFLNLPPCTYTVDASLSGFSSVHRENVVVSLGKNTNVDITLKVSTVAETVTVTSETPLIDTRKTETGATISQTELQDVPTARDPWVLLQQVPGVLVDRVNVGGSESGQQSSFVGKGSDQEAYYLDGIPVSDTGSDNASPIYFDFDSFQEVQVATGGSDITLQTPGVTLNLVTRRGTNDVKGSGRWLYTPSQWQSSNTPGEAKAEGLETNRIDFIREFGAEAGGPIAKDKAWIWGAGSRQDINVLETGTPSFETGKPVRNDTTLEDWNLKLNFQPLSSDSATLYYLRSDKTVDGRGASITRPQETSYHQSGPTTVMKLEDSHVFSSNLVTDAYFSYMESPYRLIPEGGLNTQAYRDADGVWHNSYSVYTYDTFQHQAHVDGSYFFNTGNIGHELKFGFGYRHVTVDSYSAWPGDQIYGSEASGLEPFTGYANITRPGDLKYKVNYYGTYVQDTLTAKNLTVNVGVRYDYQQAANLPSFVPANPTFPNILPSVDYKGDQGYPITWRNVQPRIGATYALGQDKKTLIRASYSRFANQLTNQIFNLNAFPYYQTIYYYWTDTNHDHQVQPGEVDLADGPAGFYYVDPNNPGAVVSPSTVAGNYKAPTTDEFIIGVDREILPDFAVSAAYTYRYIRDISATRLVGTDPSSYQLLGNATGSAVNDVTGATVNFNEPVYGLTLDPAPVGNEILNRPDYHQTYNGLELQLIKRLSHRWMMRASFAYNDWKQSVGSGAILNPNNIWGGTNQDGGLVLPNVGRTYSFANSKWQFNLSGLYQLPLGINVGANFFGRQGYLLPYYVRVRTRDTAGNRPRIQIGPNDTYRADNVYELDLRLEKTFNVGPVGLSASVDCFNVTNSNAVEDRVTNIGNYDMRNGSFSQNGQFNYIDQVQGPRIFRAGFRVSF